VSEERVVIRIVSRNTTDNDVAAVTAVLQAALTELADAEDAHPSESRSGWSRSQRDIRSRLEPGAGAWRSFSG
jgi:gamma-glutamyl:cysteine ligase YbdK (ATP-grasp superfamily)